MALVNMRDLMNHAYTNRYALCSFDLENIETLTALLDAAERCRSPVILNISESRFRHDHVGIMMAAAERAAQGAHIPVAIHFDNATTEESVRLGIKYGCNSVMYNAAEHPLPVNTQKTREICELARQCGIAMEGKLGYVNDHDTANSGNAADDIKYTCAHEAGAFVERTRIDFLTVAIGNGNGGRSSRTKLDLQRLSKIRQAVDIPLAIHEDSELSDDQHHKLISHGVAKIKYAAALLDTRSGRYTGSIRQAVEERATRYMHVCGSAGRAAEVMMQCRPWTNAEHVIIYNTLLTKDADIQYMISKGISELSRIPGVREVRAGKSIHENSTYTYTWLITFCAPEVVDYYKAASAHKHYADNEFRPNAPERITTDFKILNFNDEQPQSDQTYYRAAG